MRLPARWWMSAQFAVFFVSWSVFQTYWGVWMAGRGFDATEIGTAVGASLLARAVGVAFLFPLLNQRIDLLRLVRLLPWVVTALAVPYLVVGDFPALLATSIVFGFLYPLLPVQETTAVTAAREGLLRYGPTRAFGTAGFMVGTVAVGWLVSGVGSDVLAVVLLVSCLAAALIALIRPTGAERMAVTGTGARGFAVLLRDRSFVACLVAAAAIQGTHAAYYSFGAIRAAEIAPGELVPLLLVIAPLGEYVLFLVARSRFERLGPRLLFVIGALSAVVRWLLVAVTGTWLPFAVSQLLHAGSFATTHIAFSLYLRDRVSVDEQSAAQGLYAACSTGLSMAVLTVVAGLLIPVGFGAAMTAMAVAGLLGLVAVPFIRRPGAAGLTA